MTSETYENVGVLAAIPTFVCAWIYCIFAYGFLFGVGLGWLPAGICAIAMRWAWPAVVALLVLAVTFIVAAINS